MPSEPHRDGAKVRFPPPLVPLIALATGELLHRFVWPLALPLEGVARFGLALAGIAAGLGLMAAAMGLFRKTGQDPKPWKSSPELIRSGIYRFTRNPMYLGMGLLQAGIGAALTDGWVVLLVPLTWLIITLIAIRHEEAYLERKFGNAYVDYKRTVRRWI